MPANARYLIRLDDACPTFQYEKWKKFFDIFDKYEIKPIIAVIPDNRDSKLMTSAPMSHFWEKIKILEDKGYCIALHGYQHLYSSSHGGMLCLNAKSEFAGESYECQCSKLKVAQKIFKDHGFTPKVFVAPSHSFDNNTLKALKQTTSISIISDGITTRSFQKKGFQWIPCQLWYPIKKKSGVWTICIHPETVTDSYYTILEQFIIENRNCFTSIENVQTEKLFIKDFFFHHYFYTRRFVGKLIQKIK